MYRGNLFEAFLKQFLFFFKLRSRIEKVKKVSKNAPNNLKFAHINLRLNTSVVSILKLFKLIFQYVNFCSFCFHTTFNFHFKGSKL